MPKLHEDEKWIVERLLMETKTEEAQENIGSLFDIVLNHPSEACRKRILSSIPKEKISEIHKYHDLWIDKKIRNDD